MRPNTQNNTQKEGEKKEEEKQNIAAELISLTTKK